MKNIIIKSISEFTISSDESIDNINNHHTIIVDESHNPIAALISAEEYNQYTEYLENKKSPTTNHIYSGFSNNLNNWDLL